MGGYYHQDERDRIADMGAVVLGIGLLVGVTVILVTCALFP